MVTKAIAHGLSRAAIQKLRYGTGKGAFLSGFVSSGFSVGTKGYGGVGGRTAIMAIVGGTASEIGGGKFANGAMGSAFQYLFNDMAGEFSNTRSKTPMKSIFVNASKRSLQFAFAGGVAGSAIEPGFGTVAGALLGGTYGLSTGLIEGTTYEAIGLTAMKEYYINETIDYVENSFHNIPAPQAQYAGGGNWITP